MSETPRSLIERLVQEPDEPSWRRFAELYTPLIRYRLLQQGVPQADAEDLLQEILIPARRGRRGNRAFTAGLLDQPGMRDHILVDTDLAALTPRDDYQDLLIRQGLTDGLDGTTLPASR